MKLRISQENQFSRPQYWLNDRQLSSVVSATIEFVAGSRTIATLRFFTDELLVEASPFINADLEAAFGGKTEEGEVTA